MIALLPVIGAATPSLTLVAIEKLRVVVRRRREGQRGQQRVDVGDTIGFLGSALAYVVMQMTQCVLLLVYLWWKHPHEKGTWPGLRQPAWEKVLQWEPLKEYASLGSGGMLSQSEWIYWEAIGLIVGKLGVTEFSAHSIAVQSINVLNITAFPLGIALAIRMGLRLSQPGGKRVIRQTQMMVFVTMIITVGMFGLLSLLVGLCRETIFALFTTEPIVIHLVRSMWWKVCVFNMNISIFAMLAGVGVGLGKQWTLGVVNVFFMWVVGVPATYIATVDLGGGLDAAWTWINVPYLIINLVLLTIFVKTDWFDIHDQIMTGEICQDPEKCPAITTSTSSISESTLLLTSSETKFKELYV